MSIDNLLWVEKFRPKKIADCILPDRLKGFFQEMVDKGELQNMTLVGGAGTGKTTVARALCSEMGIDNIVINASEERNIDTIRTTVRDFGSSMSLMSNMKCVILDEADGLTPLAQQALRGVIEEFSGSCRFILTANFGNKIIPPIISRCPLNDFIFSKEERKLLVIAFGKRMRDILKQENITFDIDQLMAVVLKNFPDFRKTLNLLQRFTVNGELKVSSINALSDDSLKELAKYLKEKDFGKMRKWVVENLDNDGAMLRRSIYEKVFDLLEHESIPEIILLLNQYDYKEGFCADKEVNTVAMLVEIMATVRFQ